MIPNFNLHTHTSYSDGRNSPESMVLAALEYGCPGVGFSDHSHIPGEDWTMTPAATESYKREIRALAEKYSDRIKILLGIEYDMLSDIDTSEYDYVIGAAHYVTKDGVNIPVDETPDLLVNHVKSLYGGNFYALARDYYRTLSGVEHKTGCDIVAHTDLVSKFNGGGRLFDESDKRYLTPAFEAVDALVGDGVIFEINTGAMLRGYRKEPYPCRAILSRIAERGGRVTISSDAHNTEALLFSWKEAAAYAESVGIRELWFPKDGGFEPYCIE